MAFFDTTRPAAPGRLGRFLADLHHEYRLWRDGCDTRNALSKLTDRELYDIGLMRADLDMVDEEDLRNG